MTGVLRRPFARSVAFRISAVVLLLMGLGGGALYALVHRSLAGFAYDTVRLDMQWRARQIYGLCDRSLDELTRSGGMAVPTRVRVAKGLTLGLIEDFLRGEGVGGLVYEDAAEDPLVRVPVEGSATVGPWMSVPLGAVTERRLGGRPVYVYRVDYEPWGWHMVLVSAVSDYLGILGRVKQVYAWVAVGFVILGALLILALSRWLRRPVQAIVNDLEAGRAPRYRGVSEFEYVADRIRSTMDAEREQAAGIERLLEGTGARLALLDERGRILRANRKFLGATSLAESDVRGCSPAEVLPGLDADGRRFLGGRPSGDEEFECVERVGRGEPAWVLWRRTPVPGSGDGEPWWVLTGIDITARRRAEAERRRLAVAVEQAAEVFLLTDRDGTVQYVNPAVEAVTGFSPDEVVGNHGRMLNRSDNADRMQEAISEALRQGRSWSGRTRNRRKDDGVYEAELGASPIRDADGSLVGAVGMIRDVTREFELERQLYQAQKLDALGTLSGGIAHDFNNILAPIMGYAEMGLAQLPGDHPVHRGLEKVLASAERARDLVRQILVFGSPSGQTHRPLRLQPFVEEAASLVRASLPAGISLTVADRAKGAVVRTDPGQIEQVVVNLCTNAAHALGDSPGEIRVLLSTVEVEVPSPIVGLGEGTYLCLAVEDDGPGIPEELAQRVFEPFFTTKGPGGGTGLGLAVVHGIARAHGGAARVASPGGAGARVEVYLPRTDERPSETTASTPEKAIERGLRVLVAEDEPVVAEMIEMGLEDRGFEVVLAPDGRAALDRFEADPDGFDLVLTDHSMPRLSGDELARRVHALRPDLPIVLCSGFTRPLGEVPPETLGLSAVLHKPLRLAELASVLDEVSGAGSKDG